ncbi:hypothetical protein FRC19_001921 [Serendipita sp. 401]|nr:hypothetical protein FRC19_001921 [Serendipita sp. 401]
MTFQKDAEAIAILSKYHANGRERDPLVYFTYGQIREALAIEREINQTTSYLTLFKTPGNLRRMRIVFALGFFSQWSGNGLISFYLDPVLENVGVTVPSTRALINGGIQIWCLFVAVSTYLLFLHPVFNSLMSRTKQPRPFWWRESVDVHSF